MNWHDVFVQMIGFAGMFLYFASFQAKSNKALFALQTLGCLSFTVQFALLGAYSGCISTGINIVRNVMLTQYNSSRVVRWKGWAVAFSLLSGLAAWSTWNGYISILPVIGSIASTWGYWTNSAKKIRIANLAVNGPCMLIYDSVVHSWGGAVNEFITIISILVSIRRFGWTALNGDKIE